MLLEMLTGNALRDRMNDHIKVGATGMPSQFVFATDDPEISATTIEQAASHYLNPEMHPYTGGHFFSKGRFSELAKKLVVFFSKSSAKTPQN